MNDGWIQLVGNGAALALNGYLIHRLTRFIDYSTKEIKHSHDRLNASDRIISSVIHHAFDSSAIARGTQSYPDIKETGRVR